jgi:hypothetical protein
MIERIKEYLQLKKGQEENEEPTSCTSATTVTLPETSSSSDPSTNVLECHYCVVDGTLKTEALLEWGELIVHHGTLHVYYYQACERKRSPFVLSVAGKTPDAYIDNQVCRDCIILNEKAVQSKLSNITTATTTAPPPTIMHHDTTKEQVNQDFLDKQRQKLSEKRKANFGKAQVHTLIEENRRKKKEAVEQERIERRIKDMDRLRQVSHHQIDSCDEAPDENHNPQSFVPSPQEPRKMITEDHQRLISPAHVSRRLKDEQKRTLKS